MGRRRTKGFVRFLTILIDVAAILLPACLSQRFRAPGRKESAPGTRHSLDAPGCKKSGRWMHWRVVLSPREAKNLVSALLPPFVPHATDPNPAGRGFEPGTRSPFAAAAATTPIRCRPPRTGPSLLVFLLPADQSLVRIHQHPRPSEDRREGANRRGVLLAGRRRALPNPQSRPPLRPPPPVPSAVWPWCMPAT